jgi:hypothetical protein
MQGLETIEQRRDRLYREHGRAIAARLRAEHWQRKREAGHNPTPNQGLPEEL